MLIAITGNIGSGKSVVSQLLRTMGYEVYDCDAQAKCLMVSDKELRCGLVSLFGEETYLPDGTLNKRLLSTSIFSNPNLLEKMNSLVHPAVARDLLSKYNNPSNRIAFFESAILYESGFDKISLPDYVISVAAPLEIRISRTMSRDNISRDKVLERINNQIQQEEKNRRADFVIHNDNEHSIIEQTEKIVNLINNSVKL